MHVYVSLSLSELKGRGSQNPLHDDVIKWKHFPRYWPFLQGIHRSPVNSPHKGQWRGALMFSLICTWINRWVNNHEAGDFRSYRAHYDVIVMNNQDLKEVHYGYMLVSFVVALVLKHRFSTRQPASTKLMQSNTPVTLMVENGDAHLTTRPPTHKDFAIMSWHNNGTKKMSTKCQHYKNCIPLMLMTLCWHFPLASDVSKHFIGRDCVHKHCNHREQRICTLWCHRWESTHFHIDDFRQFHIDVQAS